MGDKINATDVTQDPGTARAGDSPKAARVYVPPTLTKKRSVARVTLQTGGVGQSTSPVIASPPATP